MLEIFFLVLIVIAIGGAYAGAPGGICVVRQPRPTRSIRPPKKRKYPPGTVEKTLEELLRGK